MKRLLQFFFVFCFGSLSAQEVITEQVLIDTSTVVYKVIHKESVGDYFLMKRYVFADDTSVVAIEKNFSNGVQNGLTRVYYPSGKLRVKAIYGNNKLQGEWVNYDEKGMIITKGVYNYGIKDGYWAYKQAGTYGRYRDGKKHRNWVKKDKNKRKYKAWYWNGEFKRGADIFKDDYVAYEDTAYVATIVNEKGEEEEVLKIDVDESLVAAVKYLSGNYYFRKVTKDFFRKSKKERKQFVDNNVDYDQDRFRLAVSSDMTSANIDWIQNEELFKKPKLDSLRSQHLEELKAFFNTQEIIQNEDLVQLSTDHNARIVLYLSKMKNNIVVAQIVEKKNESTVNNVSLLQREDIPVMGVMMLLNENLEVEEIMYQSRKW